MFWQSGGIVDALHVPFSLWSVDQFTAVWLNVASMFLNVYIFISNWQAIKSLELSFLYKPEQSPTEGRTDRRINILWFLWDKVSKFIYKRANTKQTTQQKGVPDSKMPGMSIRYLLPSSCNIYLKIQDLAQWSVYSYLIFCVFGGVVFQSSLHNGLAGGEKKNQ